MAYTDVWSDVIPADTAAANSVGAAIRQLRLDVRERINSIIGVDPSTAFSDPVLPAYTPSLFIPVWDMVFTPTASTLLAPKDTTKAGLDVVQATHTSAYFFAGIQLPIGVTLGSAYWVVNTVSGTLTYAGQFSTVAAGGTTATSLSTISGSGVSGNPYNIVSGGQSGTVTLTGNSYFAACLLTPSSTATTTVLGLVVNYTKPAVNVAI